MMIKGVILVCLIVLIQYAILIYLFYKGLHKLKNANQITDNQFYSIIIPFRNEESNLVNIVNHLRMLNYPRTAFECIFVNDESEDDSEKILLNTLKNCDFDFQILPSKGGKKSAIQTGAEHAKYPIIVCTDADCSLSANWLISLSAYFENLEIQLVLGAVFFKRNSGLLSNMFWTEFASLLASTAGSCGFGNAIMANGANIAFRKSMYHKIQGQMLNSKFASGDDTFLLGLCKKIYGNKSVAFNYNSKSLVLTNPPDTLQDFLKQRLRWASKSMYSGDIFVNYTALIVFLLNLIIPFVLISGLFFQSLYLILLFIIAFIVKSLIDYLLIKKYVSNFEEKCSFTYIIAVQIVYPYYIILVSILSPFLNIKWKGRKIKY